MGFQHLLAKKNQQPWSEEEDDLIWEHYRPGMAPELLAAALKRYGYDRSPIACRLRASRMRKEHAKQYEIEWPSDVEILALHRPWS